MLVAGCQSTSADYTPPPKIKCYEAKEHYNKGEVAALTEQLRGYGWGLSIDNQRELSLIFDYETEQEQLQFMKDVAIEAASNCGIRDYDTYYVDLVAAEMKRLRRLKDVEEGITDIPNKPIHTITEGRVFERRPLTCSEALSIQIKDKDDKYWVALINALKKIDLEKGYGEPTVNVLNYATNNQQSMHRLFNQVIVSYEACGKGVAVGMDSSHLSVLLGVIEEDVGYFTIKDLTTQEFLKEKNALDKRKKLRNYNNPLALYKGKVAKNTVKVKPTPKNNIAPKMPSRESFTVNTFGGQAAASFNDLLKQHVKKASHEEFTQMVLDHGYIYYPSSNMWRLGVRKGDEHSVNNELWIIDGEALPVLVFYRIAKPTINGKSVSIRTGGNFYHRDINQNMRLSEKPQKEVLAVPLIEADKNMLKSMENKGASYRIGGNFFETGRLESGEINIQIIRELQLLMKKEGK